MKMLSEAFEPKHKIVDDYGKLAQVITGLKILNYKVVVTIGTWDLLHIGHVRYLKKARDFGDTLIVGVDSDRTVKLYKGDLRPIVPYEERCEMLTYQSCVDLVTPIDDVDSKGRWQYGLLKAIHPDVFIAEEESYPKKQLADIRKYCGEVIILPRQAQRTSTTRMVQQAVKQHLDKMYQLLDKRA
jgi:D-glycero-beta-D-manno-heptose 1-phosphate adenylyltransferase